MVGILSTVMKSLMHGWNTEHRYEVANARLEYWAQVWSR